MTASWRDTSNFSVGGGLNAAKAITTENTEDHGITRRFMALTRRADATTDDRSWPTAFDPRLVVFGVLRGDILAEVKRYRGIRFPRRRRRNLTAAPPKFNLSVRSVVIRKASRGSVAGDEG
jgi:hypothetical protein